MDARPFQDPRLSALHADGVDGADLETLLTAVAPVRCDLGNQDEPAGDEGVDGGRQLPFQKADRKGGLLETVHPDISEPFAGDVDGIQAGRPQVPFGGISRRQDIVGAESDDRLGDGVHGDSVPAGEDKADGPGRAPGWAEAFHGRDRVHEGQRGGKTGKNVHEHAAEDFVPGKPAVEFQTKAAGDDAEHVLHGPGEGGEGVRFQLRQIDDARRRPGPRPIYGRSGPPAPPGKAPPGNLRT